LDPEPERILSNRLQHLTPGLRSQSSLFSFPRTCFFIRKNAFSDQKQFFQFPGLWKPDQGGTQQSAETYLYYRYVSVTPAPKQKMCLGPRNPTKVARSNQQKHTFTTGMFLLIDACHLSRVPWPRAYFLLRSRSHSRGRSRIRSLERSLYDLRSRSRSHILLGSAARDFPP